MGALVKNFCRHGDIDKYIENHHSRKELYKQYRRNWDNNESDLLFLLLETVSNCNLTCGMCIYSEGYDQVPRMTAEVFESVIQSVEEMSIPSISMNGTNEPLLDKKIYCRIKRILSINSVVDVHMNTNGVLLNEKNGNKILDSGLTRLLVGFDAATKQTYERVRAGSTFDTVRRNVLEFIEMRDKRNQIFPVVRLSFVRMSTNELELDSWVDFWKEIADYLSVQEFISPSLTADKDHLFPVNRVRDEQIESSSVACSQPFERVTVRGNGDVLPCCSHLATSMPIGNVLEKSVKDIWKAKKARDLRGMFLNDTWSTHPICSKCLT